MSSEEDPRWQRRPSPDDDTISRHSWGEKMSSKKEKKLCKWTTSPAVFDREKQALSPTYPIWKRLTLSQAKRDEKLRNSWDNSGRSSRSRSRSPVHGYGRRSELDDRIRGRPGLTTQICKEFSVGRCNRGSYCEYSHDDTGGHETAEKEDNAHRYHNSRIAGDHYTRSDGLTEVCNRFLKGTCVRGSSCKYIHDSGSNAYGQGSTDEMFRERESDRLNRYRTHEQRDERGSGSTPCRHFAAGNCRNGKYCRFSHGQPASSPDRRLRDHNWGQHHSVDAAEKVFKESKPSDINSVSEAVTRGENRSDKSNDEGQKVSCRSMDEERDPSFNSDNKMLAVQNERNSTFDESERKVSQLENEATNSGLGVSGPRGTVSLPDETAMSPFWNHNVQSCTQHFTQELTVGNGDEIQENSRVPTENVVCSEKLDQFNNLSTTLAQLIQQLPQICASLNSHTVDMASFANSGGPLEPVLPNDRVEAHQSEKLQDDEKVTDEIPLENENTVGKVEEGKKSKNIKRLRTFKFALVEVVKELLKPAWKEGKLDKEVHKTIVKKAVDKVTGALQEVNIPQTKEKIDNYLLSSKPKLAKLIEAYVEKFHKTKTEREAS